MCQTIVQINFPTGAPSNENFKKTLSIFNIKQVYLSKSEAFLEFQTQKDLKTFEFTNCKGRIANFSGAPYTKVDKDFQWNFPIKATMKIEDIPEHENSDETEDDSSSSQHNLKEEQTKKEDVTQQETVNLVEEQKKQDFDLLLKQQKEKQEEYRKSIKKSEGINEKVEKPEIEAPSKHERQITIRKDSEMSMQLYGFLLGIFLLFLGFY